jgi:signal transduction histidine kinase
MLNTTSSKNSFLIKRVKDKSIYSDFNMLFGKFPHIVELFDISGERVYTNRNLQFQYDRPDDQSEYNILRDPNIVETEIYTFLLNACKGEEIVIKTAENYHDFFPWYDSDSGYELTIFPVEDENNRVIYFGTIHNEIKNNRNESSLQEEERKRHESDMAYSFLRNVSHELRTPLNWILGFSELISRESNPDKIKEYNLTISKGGNLLLALIEKLLEMSAIVNNKSEMHKTKFEINPVLEEIHGLIKNELIFVGRHLKIDITNKLADNELMVVSDRIMLKQVLLNLVHNSVKFTKEGHIEIGAFKSRDDEYSFYVKDSGIGIEKDKQKDIFEVFNKANEVDINEQYGMGLGLTISGNYVKKLGGEIWVESEIGVGSTFHFTIKSFEEEAKTEEKYLFLE